MKSIDVYIIAGQSNGAGYSRFTEAKEVECGNIVLAGDAQTSNWDGNPFYTINHIMEFQPVRYGMGGTEESIGAEVGMARVLSRYYNDGTDNKCAFIKFAHGGTALLDNIEGENVCEGNWAPPSYINGSPKDERLTGGMYRGLVAQVKLRISELSDMGYTDIRFKGMFWMQGESDLWLPDEYKKAFCCFVSDLRRDLTAATGFDASSLAIYVGEISRSFDSLNPTVLEANKKFIDMQNTLSEIDGVYIVNSSQFDINPGGTDPWHWSEEDMLKIGTLVGEAMLKAL